MLRRLALTDRVIVLLVYSAFSGHNATAMNVIEYDEEVDKNATKFTLNDLPGAHTFSSIRLSAVATDGSRGVPSDPIDAVVTKRTFPSRCCRRKGAARHGAERSLFVLVVAVCVCCMAVLGRRQSVTEDLARARLHKGKTIDTYLLSNGLQRVDRAEYIKRLEDELQQGDAGAGAGAGAGAAAVAGSGHRRDARPEDAELEEEALKYELRKRTEMVDDEGRPLLHVPSAEERRMMAGKKHTTAPQPSGPFSVQQGKDGVQKAFMLRQKHFQFRISALKDKVVLLDAQKEKLLMERNGLAKGDHKAHVRLTMLTTELTRLAHVDPLVRVVESNVPTGAPHQYSVAVLVHLLMVECIRLRRDMMEPVRQVQNYDAKRQVIRRQWLETTQAIRERENKLKEITKTYLKLQSNVTLAQMMYGRINKVGVDVSCVVVLRVRPGPTCT